MVTMRVLKELVYETPVDKGVARSNWRVGVGRPTSSVISAYRPYPAHSGPNKGETANASAAIQAGRERIYGAKSNRSVGRFSVAFFIANHVPYIDKINEGYSKQSTPGWIERALEQGAHLKGFRVFTDDEDEE